MKQIQQFSCQLWCGSKGVIIHFFSPFFFLHLLSSALCLEALSTVSLMTRVSIYPIWWRNSRTLVANFMQSDFRDLKKKNQSHAKKFGGKKTHIYTHTYPTLPGVSTDLTRQFQLGCTSGFINEPELL